MSHRHIEEHVVVDSETHKSSNQFEVDIRFKSLAVEPIQLNILVEFEHAILGIKKFFHDETKILFHYTTHVDAGFIFKLSFQWKF